MLAGFSIRTPAGHCQCVTCYFPPNGTSDGCRRPGACRVRLALVSASRARLRGLFVAESTGGLPDLGAGPPLSLSGWTSGLGLVEVAGQARRPRVDRSLAAPLLDGG